MYTPFDHFWHLTLINTGITAILFSLRSQLTDSHFRSPAILYVVYQILGDVENVVLSLLTKLICLGFLCDTQYYMNILLTYCWQSNLVPPLIILSDH